MTKNIQKIILNLNISSVYLNNLKFSKNKSKKYFNLIISYKLILDLSFIT